MDFSLTDDQDLLRTTARKLLGRECPTTLVRAHMEDRAAADGLWEHLRQWYGLAQGPLTDLCLFLEETGAVLAPGPFLPTAVLLVPLLEDIFGWDSARIRSFFESRGLALQEWEKVRTDLITVFSTIPTAIATVN